MLFITLGFYVRVIKHNKRAWFLDAVYQKPLHNRNRSRSLLFYPASEQSRLSHAYPPVLTRSQAVAEIAECTASQHILGSGDVIGHVTI